MLDEWSMSVGHWWSESVSEVLKCPEKTTMNPILTSLRSNPGFHSEVLVTNGGGWLSIPGQLI